jgi:hypothetical protein
MMFDGPRLALMRRLDRINGLTTPPPETEPIVDVEAIEKLRRKAMPSLQKRHLKQPKISFLKPCSSVPMTRRIRSSSA